jgi:hypothetical protein
MKTFRAIRWRNSRVHIIDNNGRTLCEPNHAQEMRHHAEPNLELPLSQDYKGQLRKTCEVAAQFHVQQLWRPVESVAVNIAKHILDNLTVKRNGILLSSDTPQNVDEVAKLVSEVMK